MTYTIAVVGATGNVGKEMLAVLAERNFPVKQVHALASRNSVGREVSFGEERTLKVEDLEHFDFSDVDIGFFSPGAAVSKIHAPRAAKSGCVVIDNTSHFRMEEDVPLVVPEVNATALKDFSKRHIIANPNCSTIQMVTALKPLHDIAPIKRVVVATYQSVSGAGKAAMDELYNQTKHIFAGQHDTPQQFTKRIAFNAIPHIDVFVETGPHAGATKEEWKMIVETQKILDPNIRVSATCVRLPVFVGHGEAVHVEFAKPITEKQARAALEAAPGVALEDQRQDGGYVTPQECVGLDDVFVSRLRKDPSVEHGLNFWVVADNMRKGAALNAVQIAETLIKDHGLSPK